jgi:hypothetical protein
MVLAQLGDCIRIASMDGAEQFFGLTLKLFEIGPDGQATDGHGEPPSMRAWSAGVGQGGSAIASEGLGSSQVESVLSADGKRPVRPTSNYH